MGEAALDFPVEGWRATPVTQWGGDSVVPHRAGMFPHPGGLALFPLSAVLDRPSGAATLPHALWYHPLCHCMERGQGWIWGEREDDTISLAAR